MKPKLIRITTIPESLKILLKGQLNFMSSNGFDVKGVSSGGKSLKDVKDLEDINVFEIEMSRRIDPIKDLSSLWYLYKYFKLEKPLIVHTHTPKAGTLGMFASKLSNVPIRLHTVAGLPLLEASGVKKILLIFIEKLTYACATKVYPNSKNLLDIIIKNKITSRDKLKVIGKGSSNGIDTSFFDPALISEQQKVNLKNSLNIKLSDFVYVFVGRIVGDKGINELISAFDMVQKTKINVKLVLVGDYERELDPLKADTEHIIKTNPNIVFVGIQSDVRPYFAIADVFVFPSYREGFPNSLMQAGAMGVASIATDINGCNEIITNGFNGVIIPRKNKEILFEKMIFLLENPQKRKEFASNSRKQIVENYDRKFIWNELLKEYQSLLYK